MNTAGKIWHDRYWLNANRDLRDIRERQAEVTETLTRIGLVMKYTHSSRKLDESYQEPEREDSVFRQIVSGCKDTGAYPEYV